MNVFVRHRGFENGDLWLPATPWVRTRGGSPPVGYNPGVVEAFRTHFKFIAAHFDTSCLGGRFVKGIQCVGFLSTYGQIHDPLSLFAEGSK